jgi:2-haloalkanoic acid dehalogenase type II
MFASAKCRDLSRSRRHTRRVLVARDRTCCTAGIPRIVVGMTADLRPRAVLFDLLMAVMNSPATWAAAAGDPGMGMRWRDAVTERMRQAERYVPYHALVAEAGIQLRLPPDAADRLREKWRHMRPWPDATELATLPLPFAFVTNCSAELAREATARSGLSPRFTLSAEEAGRYKPSREIYRAACQRIGSAPERTVFVAGAAYDAEGARAAGLRAVLVRRRPPSGPLNPEIMVVDSLGAAMREAL